MNCLRHHLTVIPLGSNRLFPKDLRHDFLQ